MFYFKTSSKTPPEKKKKLPKKKTKTPKIKLNPSVFPPTPPPKKKKKNSLSAKLFVVFWLVVEPTHLRNMLVKLDHETPRFRGENKKCLSCHHPVECWYRISRFPFNIRCYKNPVNISLHHPVLGGHILAFVFLHSSKHLRSHRLLHLLHRWWSDGSEGRCQTMLLTSLLARHRWLHHGCRSMIALCRGRGREFDLALGEKVRLVQGKCHNHLRNFPKKIGETRNITKGQTLPVNL